MLLEGVPQGEEFSSCPGGPVGHPQGPQSLRVGRAPAPQGLLLPTAQPRISTTARAAATVRRALGLELQLCSSLYESSGKQHSFFSLSVLICKMGLVVESIKEPIE